MARAGTPVPGDGLANVSYDQATNRINTAGWEYDAAGNQTRVQRVDLSWQRYVYDAAGRLVKVQNDSNVTQLVNTYGASNHRLIEQVGNESSNQRTYYAWAGDSVIAEYSESATNPTTPLWSKSYVYLGGRLLTTIAPNGGSERVEYQHPDRLGTRLVTNNQDGTSFEQVSLPFGTALDAESTGSTKRRFTSYDRSNVTGLDYAVNRHYDPLQGRFTQVDPIGMASVSLENPQSLNLYAYCTNDPINHTDPSGLGFFSFLGKIFGFIGKVLHFVAKVLAVVAAVAAVVFLAWGMPAYAAAFAFISGLLFASAYGPPIVGRLLNAIGAAALQARSPVIAGTPPINPNGGSGIGPVNSFLQGESRTSGPTIAFGPRYQNLIQLFKDAFDNAVNRIKSKKDCAKLFGGQQKALNALNSATYRLFDEPPNLRYENGKWVPHVIGAATYPGNMVTINISGPFFNGPDLKMSGNRSFRADLGTGLKGNDLAALLLLHELGHQVGKWGTDAGVGDRDANLEHSRKVHEACFK